MVGVKNERLGLVLIASSLLVILVTTGLLLKFQTDSRREQARFQGVSLARLLSRVPYQQLVPGTGHQGPLHVIKHAQGNPDFVYATVVGVRGRTLAEVTSPGVIVPQTPIGSEPSSWLGERVLEQTGAGGSVREFFAPVLTDGEIVAHVRIGFLEPGYAMVFEHVPFFALLALPIFLLAPLSYFLIRREIAPIAAAGAGIRELLDGGTAHAVQVDATGELGEFIQSFNRFVAMTQQRLQDYRSERTGMLASSKVISYQKTRIESVLDALPDAVLVLDESGAVGLASAKLETMIGVPAQIAMGNRPQDWCESHELLAFLSRFQREDSQLHRAEAMEFSPEETHLKRLLAIAYPLLPARTDSGAAGTLVIIRDISAEFAARQGQADFVDHVAHEIKSPLNVLSMYSETLLGKDGESEDFRIEACNVIRDEVERLSTLISTLLSIARLEASVVGLNRQRVRLADFLGDTLEAVSRNAKDGSTSCKLDLSGEYSPIYVDKALLRVAINNLLTNAIKYTDAGDVTLSAEETEESVFIRVRDTGIGIPEQDQPRIFEKFFRSDDPGSVRRGGHGLGLTLARQIVELHGGEMALNSAQGEGSEFSIALPKASALLQERVQS